MLALSFAEAFANPIIGRPGAFKSYLFSMQPGSGLPIAMVAQYGDYKSRKALTDLIDII